MKKLLALLLALVMCLALFACSDQSSTNDDDDDDDKGSKKPESSTSSSNEAVGTWILNYTNEDVPFSITFDDDGSCKFSTGESYTWKKKLNKNSETDDLNLLLKDDGESVYSVWVSEMDDGNMTLSLSAVDDDDNETYLASYSTQNITPDSDLLDQIAGQWHADTSYEYHPSVTINEDGTCSIDDETLSWTASYWNNENRSLSLNIFDVEAVRYYISFDLYDSDVMRMCINDADYNDSCTLYRAPLISVLMNGNWCDFAYGETQVSEFYFSNDYCSVNWDDHDWKLVSCEEDKLTATISEEDSSEVKYELTLTMEGEYPQIALLDCASGETWLYYCSNLGYDETNPEANYQLAVYNLSILENDGSFWVEESEEWIYDNEGYTYVYQMFQSLGDYKDSADYLARFTIHPNMLTGVDVEYTDNLGNVDEGYLSEYEYDANGNLIYATGSDIREKYCISSSYVYGDMYFEYDEAGVISQILIGYSNTDLKARCTPTYDANGNMISLQIQTNSGETTATFTYDDQNRLIHAIGPYTYSGDPQTITYTYDAAGQLVQKTRSWTDWWVYEEVTTYTYANGVLKEAVTAYSQTDSWSGTTTITSTFTYTCDEQGNPLTVSYTTDDPSYNYASQVRTYTYEDLYFYTSET